MAEEENDEGGGAKSSKKFLIIIILAVAVLAGGGGAAGFMMGSGQEEQGQDTHAKTDKKGHDEEEDEENQEEPGPVVDLEAFLLNLADRDGQRYLKMTIKLELDRPEAETDFAVKVPAIRDSLLVLLSSKESHLLKTANGKRRVRDEILARANRVMKKGKVSNVFFTDFVIQ